MNSKTTSGSCRILKFERLDLGENFEGVPQGALGGVGIYLPVPGIGLRILARRRHARPGQDTYT